MKKMNIKNNLSKLKFPRFILLVGSLTFIVCCICLFLFGQEIQYGYVYTLDVTNDKTCEVLMHEIFGEIQNGITFHDVRIIIGKDATLLVTCSIPCESIQNVLSNDNWKVPNATGETNKFAEVYHWKNVDVNLIDSVFINKHDFSKVFLSKQQNGNSLLYIETAGGMVSGRCGRFSKEFWEHVNIFAKRKKPISRPIRVRGQSEANQGQPPK